MKRKLFDKTLDFEINLIGYRNQGESIIFFLKADNRVIYAGLVDCYEEESENMALSLMENEKIARFDFVCWTHPHDDHTLGLDRVLKEFCDEKTLFWMPPFVSNDVVTCSSSAHDVYKILFQTLESMKKRKMNIREASDAKILEKFECSGNVSMNPYIFEIRSFAPDSNILAGLKLKERFNMGNVYSIGLIINVGHYYIVLAGDVENRTLKCIPDFNFDIQDRIDYVKIPHHASSTASYLIDKFNGLGIAAPTIATTTVYRIHKLPNKEVLKRYVMWDNDTKVYSTGDIECIEHDIEKNGIVQTTFDILEQRKKPIETTLFGNAICVSDIM